MRAPAVLPGAPWRAPLLAAGLLLTLAATACREPARASPEYARAHGRFAQLYAQKLDDAYVDPEMARIEALLAQVPAGSRDAPAARELQARISEGRARSLGERRAREKALAEAHAPLAAPTAPVTPPPNRSPEPGDAGVGGRPDAGQEADGGLAGQGPGPGTPEDEVAHRFRGCFQRAQDITIVGRGLRTSYSMVDRLSCRLEYPAQVGQVLLMEEGKVLALVPASSLRTEPADAGR